MARHLLNAATALAVVAVVVIACSEPATTESVRVPQGSPEGEPLLPDLAPVPAIELHVLHEDDKVELRFSSTLANVGAADFVLHGTRESNEADDWSVRQEITYSAAGSASEPTDAAMIWGGDGHDHWHVLRVAEYRLEQLDDEGNVLPDNAKLDAKIGFCFFDVDRELEEFGPEEAAWTQEECGGLDDLEFRMGLSEGWSDTYDYELPGQSFDITDMPDGRYRLSALADPRGWFQEATTDNNFTWLELDLFTTDEGTRAAFIQEIGPIPVPEPRLLSP